MRTTAKETYPRIPRGEQAWHSSPQSPNYARIHLSSLSAERERVCEGERERQTNRMSGLAQSQSVVSSRD